MVGWVVGIEVGVAEGVDGCAWVLRFADLENGGAADTVGVYRYSSELVGNVSREKLSNRNS